MGPFPKNSARHERIIRITGKCHQRSTDSCSRRTRGEAKRQILALPLQHGGLGLTDPRETAKTEYKHYTQITDKPTTKIYTQKLDLDYNPSDQLHTTHEKQNTTKERKMPKQLRLIIKGADP